MLATLCLSHKNYQYTHPLLYSYDTINKTGFQVEAPYYLSLGFKVENMASAGDVNEEVLEPQGTHHAWWSIAPFTEALSWASTPGVYFDGLSTKYDGAPVYKCHPGIASIAITDHASGKWFFNQPDSVLDRQVCS